MPPTRSDSFKRFIQYLTEYDTTGQAEYWASELENAPVTDYPELPTPDYVARATKTSKISMCIDFQHILKSRKVTVSTVVRAAWAIVLARHSNSDDVSFGVVLSGRNAPLEGIEEMTGPTLVTVPVRIRVHDTCVLAELLSTIQDQAVHMMPFEHTGIHNIQNISTSARHACSFRTVLVVQPEEEPSESEFLHDLNHLGSMQRSSPLTIDCQLEKGAMTLYAHFDDAVISQQDVDWVLLHMQESLLALTSGDGMVETVGQVSIFGGEDLRQIREWNEDCPQKVDHCLHDLFERKAVENPLDIAIYDQMTAAGLSYGELDSMSTRLAHRLEELQVMPETLVPICFEGSSMAIIAIIAVLKAGGAYVPLDISQPESELKSIIREVNAKFILCSASCAPRFGGIVAQVVIVDASSMINYTPSPGRRLARKAQTNNIAFIKYSSGRTGALKAVVLSHSAISTSASHLGTFYGIRKNTRVLLYTSFTADMSLKEIFITLLHGGCICIPTEYNRLNKLSKAAGDMVVDAAFLTPTVAGQMRPQECPSLKILCVGGEYLTRYVADMWCGRVEIFNSYGPAETGMDVSATSPLTPTSNLANIGCAVTGLIWIITLDEPRRLAPVGCPGEIAFSGHTLARGYLNDEEKTLSAFIETPGWTADCALPTRCYLTGDTGCYNSDGSVRFLGRLDRQIKLNGLRIEMGEIEYQLRAQNDQISQAVAELVTIGQQNDPPALVVFVKTEPSQLSCEPVPLLLLTPSDGFRKLASDARNRLRDVLPLYMIPEFFILVSQIPMTTSGKIDRKKLTQAAMQLDHRELEVLNYPVGSPTSELFPQSETERIMCKLWKEILNIGDEASLTASDNFFHLGGDSIAVIRLIAGARKIGLSISSSQIFKTPRLGSIASCAKFTTDTRALSIAPFALPAGMELEEVASLCKVQVANIEDVYASTALQEGLMALSARNGVYVAQQVYILSDVNESRFRTAWERTVNRNPILRTRIVHSTEYGSLQVVCEEFPGNLWYTGKDLEQYLRKDRDDLITMGSRLCRFALIQERESTLYFVLTVHHAVSANTREFSFSSDTVFLFSCTMGGRWTY